MKLRSRETPTIAAARAGFSAGAAYRFEGDGRAFPSSAKCRGGGAARVRWPGFGSGRFVPMISAAPGLRAIRRVRGDPRGHPELKTSIRRTVERRAPGVRDRGATRATVTLFRGPERPSSADTNTGAGR
jgi:hypothetical protein